MLNASFSKRDVIFSLLLLSLCVVLWLVDFFPIKNSSRDACLCRGLVTAVDNSHVRVNLIVKTQTQFLTVRLLSGAHKGQTIPVENMLTGKMEIDEFYETGDRMLLEYDVVDGRPVQPLARGHYRLGSQALLFGLFAMLLAIIAGTTGLKALLSFVFTALMLWKILFPAMLNGYNPIPLGLGVVAVMTAVVTFAVGGFNRRGLAAFAGSMLGLLLTAALATWFTHDLKLHGAVAPFAETLLYSGYLSLNLGGIFVASVFLSSSGAVMDLAMDIAVAMHEVRTKLPKIGYLEHLQSGLRMGRAVIGAMTTTLLLAYTGSHMTMFMLFIGKGIPLERVLNIPMVAAESLSILVGSFGLVTVAPFTALVSALLFRRNASVAQPE